ncbi:hypothetical protein OROMI_025077 [Orobanche minor]
MFFLARYCKLLEENSFRGRTADFFYMLSGATVLTGIVLIGGMIPYVSESFAKITFLSNSIIFMMNIICVEQAEPIHSHELLGPFHFHMAYLPWVLLGFSILVGASAWVDLLGFYQVAKWNAIKVSIEIIDKDGHADPESMYMCLRSSAYFLLVLPNFVC